MFFRLYKTRLKCLFKNYGNMFWSFGFPIILAIFFYMGFYNMINGETVDSIRVAVISENNAHNEFTKDLENIEVLEDSKLFDVYAVTLSSAKELLNNNKIAGYIIFQDKPILYVKKNGIEQSVIKSFVDKYEQELQTKSSITTLKRNNLNNAFKDYITTNRNYIVNEDNKYKNPSSMLVYFYALIALACLLGTNWGFREMIDIQADQSNIGARIQVTPVHKFYLVFCNLLAAFTLHFTSVLILVSFMVKVLNIKFGGKTWMLVLVCFLGSICGITLGTMVCVAVKANAKVREALLNMIILGGSFLSGMMLLDMKYLVATKAPLISYINPASLITDAFYCLYNYDNYLKFMIDLGILATLTIVFGLITLLKIRRNEYASI